MLLTEMDGVLGLERLNLAGAWIRAQAIAVAKEHVAGRLISDMERDANR